MAIKRSLALFLVWQNDLPLFKPLPYCSRIWRVKRLRTCTYTARSHSSNSWVTSQPANTIICKQKHPLMSSHSQESFAVKLRQPRWDIPMICGRLITRNKNYYSIWIQLVNNEWIHFSHSTDIVTVFCSGSTDIIH
jgi:hypothetical protein